MRTNLLPFAKTVITDDSDSTLIFCDHQFYILQRKSTENTIITIYSIFSDEHLASYHFSSNEEIKCLQPYGDDCHYFVVSCNSETNISRVYCCNNINEPPHLLFERPGIIYQIQYHPETSTMVVVNATQERANEQYSRLTHSAYIARKAIGSNDFNLFIEHESHAKCSDIQFSKTELFLYVLNEWNRLDCYRVNHDEGGTLQLTHVNHTENVSSFSVDNNFIVVSQHFGNGDFVTHMNLDLQHSHGRFEEMTLSHPIRLTANFPDKPHVMLCYGHNHYSKRMADFAREHADGAVESEEDRTSRSPYVADHIHIVIKNATDLSTHLSLMAPVDARNILLSPCGRYVIAYNAANIYFWHIAPILDKRTRNQFTVINNNGRALHIQPTTLLRIARNTCRTLLQEHRATKPTTLADGAAWLQAAGRLCLPIVGGDMRHEDTGKLYPQSYNQTCTINVGTVNPTAVQLKNLRKDALVVFPDSGHDYRSIATRMLQIIGPQPQLPRGMSHLGYLLFPQAMPRLINYNHSKVAVALLNRIRGFDYPQKLQTHRNFLDHLLMLMLGVEGSRNNTTYLTLLMHLDLIAANCFYGRRSRAYSWNNAFVGAYGTLWSDYEAKDYGGKYPMATNSTGQGNLSARNQLLNQTDNLEDVFMQFLNDKQHHRIPLKEVSIIRHWLAALPASFQADLQRCNSEAELAEMIRSILFNRLQHGFFHPDADEHNLLVANNEHQIIRGTTALNDDRREPYVYAFTHTNSHSGNRRHGLHYHRLDSACKANAGYAIRGETKALRDRWGQHNVTATINIVGKEQGIITVAFSTETTSLNYRGGNFRFHFSTSAVLNIDISIHAQRYYLGRVIPPNVYAGDIANIPEDQVFAHEDESLMLINPALHEKIYNVLRAYFIAQFQNLNGSVIVTELDTFFNRHWQQSSNRNKFRAIFNASKDFLAEILGSLIPEPTVTGFRLSAQINKMMLAEQMTASNLDFPDEHIAEFIDFLFKQLRERLCKPADSPVYQEGLKYTQFSSETYVQETDNSTTPPTTGTSISCPRILALCQQQGLPQDNRLLRFIFELATNSYYGYSLESRVEYQGQQLQPCSSCYEWNSTPYPCLPYNFDAIPCMVDNTTQRYHRIDSDCAAAQNPLQQNTIFIAQAEENNIQACPDCWLILQKRPTRFAAPVPALEGDDWFVPGHHDITAKRHVELQQSKQRREGAEEASRQASQQEEPTPHVVRDTELTASPPRQRRRPN